MSPTVRTEDLIDAREVAELLGLAHYNSTSTYLQRYADMPRPVVDRGPKRARLWLRPEIEAWARTRMPQATQHPLARPQPGNAAGDRPPTDK
jgi:glutathione-regulated potassium-efflux system ancillary protein KefG